MPASLRPGDDIQYLKGVGPHLSQRLRKLGIETIHDLFLFLPRDYEDRRNLRRLAHARDGEKATFFVESVDVSSFYYRGKRHPKIKVTDGSGTAALFCFNRNFLAGTLAPGTRFYLTGPPLVKRGGVSFSQFDYAPDGSGNLRILPVYSLTEGVSQKKLRSLSSAAIGICREMEREDIPRVIAEGYGFARRGDLLAEVHYPVDMESLRRIKETLSYEEFFKYQLVVALNRSRMAHTVKERRPCEDKLKKRFIQDLHFELTGAQARVLRDMEQDLSSPSPMNRLIQGDVGCGKTVVALIGCLRAIETGGQVGFMAPTEILARQHLRTISSYLRPMDLAVDYVSGGVRGADRTRVTERLKKGTTDILIGTHALFSDDIVFKNLSLVVIDEQHRFGVLQRGRLREKGDHPDCMVMSATPIPRTLSMTLYGDLDVSVIDEMPKGRAGVETVIEKQAGLEKVYSAVRAELQKGRQAYFVYPVIEDSADSDLKNAVEAHARLKEVFSGYRVGLMHGRLSDDEKEDVMGRFRDGHYHILVSTTVVEVGIDVPNATVMVIEQAERFGLSNIHQLRGRIGRGAHRSFCYLVPDRSTGRDSFNRLRILRDTDDGFKIAEWDLRLRGPGEVMGRKQSGIPSFLIDNMDINTKLIARAQKDARRYVNGKIGSEEERKRYLDGFTKSDAYKNAVVFYGG